MIKANILGAAVAAALLGLSTATIAQTSAPVYGAPVYSSGGGVGGSAGGTGASPVDTPREANRSAPGANPDVTGPQGASSGSGRVAPATGAVVVPAPGPVVAPATGAVVAPAGTVVAPATPVYGAPVTSAGGGVGGSAGGTGASPVDSPRELNRSTPGANADITGPQGANTVRCDALVGDERVRCLRAGVASTGASGGLSGVGGSAGGTGASPVDTPREMNRSAPGGNPDVTGPRGR